MNALFQYSRAFVPNVRPIIVVAKKDQTRDVLRFPEHSIMFPQDFDAASVALRAVWRASDEVSLAYPRRLGSGRGCDFTPLGIY